MKQLKDYIVEKCPNNPPRHKHRIPLMTRLLLPIEVEVRQCKVGRGRALLIMRSIDEFIGEGPTRQAVKKDLKRKHYGKQRPKLVIKM